MNKNYKRAWGVLSKGGVAVVPTDTVYGLVAKAHDEHAVGRVYELKKRAREKGLIVIIATLKDLDELALKTGEKVKSLMFHDWSAPVSFILESTADTPTHLPQKNNTLAVRVVREKELANLLKKTGPLVAPSANISDEKTAQTTEEAKGIFGSSVDAYIDGGRLSGKPSTLVGFGANSEIQILREGTLPKREVLEFLKRKNYIIT